MTMVRLLKMNKSYSKYDFYDKTDLITTRI